MWDGLDEQHPEKLKFKKLYAEALGQHQLTTPYRRSQEHEADTIQSVASSRLSSDEAVAESWAGVGSKYWPLAQSEIDKYRQANGTRSLRALFDRARTEGWPSQIVLPEEPRMRTADWAAFEVWRKHSPTLCCRRIFGMDVCRTRDAVFLKQVLAITVTTIPIPHHHDAQHQQEQPTPPTRTPPNNNLHRVRVRNTCPPVSTSSAQKLSTC